MRNTIEHKYFRTTDLALASFLQLRGCAIDLTDGTSHGNITFVIPKDASLEEIVRDFWAGRQLVEPTTYFQALRLLKSRIHQQR